MTLIFRIAPLGVKARLRGPRSFCYLHLGVSARHFAFRAAVPKRSWAGASSLNASRNDPFDPLNPNHPVEPTHVGMWGRSLMASWPRPCGYDTRIPPDPRKWSAIRMIAIIRRI
jgi:hypothetical protein